MARLNGELYSIARRKDGQYRVTLLLDNDGIEEESVRDYAHLKDVPRCIFSIVDGKIKYHRSLKISVQLAYEDSYGVAWFPDSIRLEE